MKKFKSPNNIKLGVGCITPYSSSEDVSDKVRASHVKDFIKICLSLGPQFVGRGGGGSVN